MPTPLTLFTQAAIALYSMCVAPVQSEVIYLPELIKRLQWRDERLGGIQLQYEVSTSLGYWQTGTFGVADNDSFFLDFYHSTGAPDSKALHAWVAWNGAHMMSMEDLDLPYPVMLVSPTLRSPASAFQPDSFGVWFQHERIGRFFASVGSHSLRVLGRETIRGADCVVIEYDRNLQSPENAVALFWLDDKNTLLALRAAMAKPAQDADPTTWSLMPQSRPYSLYAVWDSIQNTTLPSGVHITTEGVASAPLHPGSSPSVLKVDVDSIREGFSTASSTLFPPVGRRYFVEDEVGRERYTLGPDGRGTVQTLAFYREVAQDAKRRGFEPAPEGAGALGFENSSCGPNAVLHVAQASGRRATLEELGRFGRTASGRTSLEDLQGMCEAVDLHSLPVVMNWRKLRSLLAEADLWCIAHLPRPPQQTREVLDHFVLIDRIGLGPKDVRLVSPPFTPGIMAEEAFLECWEGRALLVTPERSRLGEIARSVEPVWLYRARTPILLICLAIVISILIRGLLRGR